jgi:hypothetical protein
VSPLSSLKSDAGTKRNEKKGYQAWKKDIKPEIYREVKATNIG